MRRRASRSRRRRRPPGQGAVGAPATPRRPATTAPRPGQPVEPVEAAQLPQRRRLGGPQRCRPAVRSGRRERLGQEHEQPGAQHERDADRHGIGPAEPRTSVVPNRRSTGASRIGSRHEYLELRERAPRPAARPTGAPAATTRDRRLRARRHAATGVPDRPVRRTGRTGAVDEQSGVEAPVGDDVITVDGDRLRRSLMELARIGAHRTSAPGWSVSTGSPSPTPTPPPGVSDRLDGGALGPAAVADRRAVGNVYDRRDGTEPGVKPSSRFAHRPRSPPPACSTAALACSGPGSRPPPRRARHRHDPPGRGGPSSPGRALPHRHAPAAPTVPSTDLFLTDRTAPPSAPGSPATASWAGRSGARRHAYLECHQADGAGRRRGDRRRDRVQGVSWQVTLDGRFGHAARRHGASNAGLANPGGRAPPGKKQPTRGRSSSAPRSAGFPPPRPANVVPGRATFTIDLRSPTTPPWTGPGRRCGVRSDLEAARRPADPPPAGSLTRAVDFDGGLRCRCGRRRRPRLYSRRSLRSGAGRRPGLRHIRSRGDDLRARQACRASATTRFSAQACRQRHRVLATVTVRLAR